MGRNMQIDPIVDDVQDIVDTSVLEILSQIIFEINRDPPWREFLWCQIAE